MVRLNSFNNDWYNPGRSPLWRFAWLLVGLPILRSQFLLSSSFKVWLLRAFGARAGSGIVIKPGVRVKYPWRLVIGNDCWIGEDCWIDNLADVKLGNDVCLSQGTYLCTGNHDWSDPAFGLKIGSITLDDGSWAGARATLLPGVHMSEGSVAAAGSVVVKSIPAYEVHAGNPAVFVRTRRFRNPETLSAGR